MYVIINREPFESNVLEIFLLLLPKCTFQCLYCKRCLLLFHCQGLPQAAVCIHWGSRQGNRCVFRAPLLPSCVFWALVSSHNNLAAVNKKKYNWVFPFCVVFSGRVWALCSETQALPAHPLLVGQSAVHVPEKEKWRRRKAKGHLRAAS